MRSAHQPIEPSRASGALRRPLGVATITLTVGIAVAITAGCGNSATSPKTGSSNSVVIGWEGGSGDPLAVTVGNNHFAKQVGANTQLKLFASGPAALSAIASGSLQYMCGLGLPPTVSALAKDVPLEIIFNQERYTTGAGLVVKSGSGISKVADLKGKTLAIVMGSQSTFELNKYLEGSGISPTDVKLLNMSPDQMQSAWSTGSIKAALTWDPVFSALASKGGHIIKTDKDLPPDTGSYNICVANKDYASKHPQVTAKVLAALEAGTQDVKTNRSDALKVMAKQTGTSVPGVTKILSGYDTFDLSGQTTPNVLGSGSGTSSSATGKSLIANWNVLYSSGFISKKPPATADKYINSSYAADALKAK